MHTIAPLRAAVGTALLLLATASLLAPPAAQARPGLRGFAHPSISHAGGFGGGGFGGGGMAHPGGGGFTPHPGVPRHQRPQGNRRTRRRRLRP